MIEQKGWEEILPSQLPDIIFNEVFASYFEKNKMIFEQDDDENDREKVINWA